MWSESRRERRRGNWVTPVILRLFYRCQWGRRVSPVFFSTPPPFSLFGWSLADSAEQEQCFSHWPSGSKEGGVARLRGERERKRDIGSCKEMLYMNARAQATVVQQQIMWSAAALTSFPFFLRFIFHSFVLSLKPLPVLLQDPVKQKSPV